MIASFEIEPASDGFSAAIRGLDLATPIDAAASARVAEAFLAHKVLVFRGQHLDVAGFAKAGGIFGRLVEHALDQYRHPEWPAVSIISNRNPRTGIVDPKGAARGTGWHTDQSYARTPCKATALYAVVLPSSGGDTLFVDTARAYADLAPEVRVQADRAAAMFSWGGRNPGNAAPLTPEQRVRLPDVVHPLVLEHPETGAKALYIDETNAVRVVDTDTEIGEALLARLFAHATSETYLYRHRWTKGDLVVWDNRCTAHRAAGGYPPGEERTMYRTQIA
ncbi:MAG: TauD/TfdA family dioxygenase [Magnetospirillum sp.]|jgi:taurine dioxygenase|nr:TauD/TfdA family dioxygenase [Magnetospirillum sp.]